MTRYTVLLLLLLSTACRTGRGDSSLASEAEAARIVAMGDVHGDLDAAKRALQLAGAVDASGNWIGGALVVVQVGDQTDRGPDDKAILDYFAGLATAARAAGGAFHWLLGNHETMNAALDFRYVSPQGFSDFAPYARADETDARILALPGAQRGRARAFIPGGVYALRLAANPVALQLGDTVFVHGGISPEYAREGLAALNADVAAWLRGETPTSRIADAEDGPLWNRDYSDETDADDCAALAEALQLLGARRMVVAHTPQEHGINDACDGRVWRVDTGMSAHYGGPVQVLEIAGTNVTVRRER